IKGEHPGLSI
nr:p23=amphoterin homolog {Lys-C digestion product, internal fragment} [cattle, lung, Peptide Partial, 10 aa] [Bos taurus]